jgi:hypothetical protein
MTEHLDSFARLWPSSRLEAPKTIAHNLATYGLKSAVLGYKAALVGLILRSSLATPERAPERGAEKRNRMLRRPLFALAGLVLTITGCAKDNDTPAAAPAPYTAPSAATTAQPVATAYPQPAVVAATPAPVAPAPAVVPATPAVAGTMATPNAFALPCQNDQSCGFARCNVQFQKCAFPCQSAVDCAANASCNAVTGLCLPGVAPQ